MIKTLIYSTILLIVVTAIATIYLLTSDKQTAFSDIRVENASLRLPAPGQSTAAAYFDIINDGGANQLLSVRTPVSNRVELHTHLHEGGMMKMRQVDSVKIMPKQTTQFKHGGLHVMIFNVNIPKGATEIPLTLTFARPPVYVPVVKDAQDKKIDVPKVLTITVLATVEG